MSVPPPAPKAVPSRVVDGPVPLAAAEARQEALLGLGAPAVYVGVADGRCLSYGVRVAETAPYLARARADGVPVLRRRSGGTGVLVGAGDLLWGIVVPRTEPLAGRDFVRAYDRLGAGVVGWLGAAGVVAGWTSPPGLSDDYCPLGRDGAVLEAGGRIVAAAAQHATARALLHHGVVARAVDHARIARYFDLAEPEVAAHLGGWEEIPAEIDPGRAAPDLAAHLARSFAAAPVG